MRQAHRVRKRHQITPEDILAEHSPQVRELAGLLRQIVRETVLDASESAYPGWHAIGYRHPVSGYFCGIFPYDEGVNLGFEFGVLLPDPAGLLEGDGKQVRYIRIREAGDIRAEAICGLIQAAIDLPPEREAKLWLIQSAAQAPRSQP